MKAIISTLFTLALTILPCSAVTDTSAATADITSAAVAGMTISLVLAYFIVKKIK